MIISTISYTTLQRRVSILLTWLTMGLVSALVPQTASAQSPAPVVLGAAGNFGVLGGSTVTSTGNSIINGDLGLSPGPAVNGFPPGSVTGSLFINSPEAVNGQADLTTAYNDAAGRSTNPISVAGNIGGQTLPPGLYKSQTSLAISSGDLTLNAQGDQHAVWIFQAGSTLTTTSGRQVILSGGAQAANVFWQVGTSAVLGTTSAFVGTIMADQSITLETGATLNGRALARIGAVTLDGNDIVVPSAVNPPILEDVYLRLPQVGAEPNIPISIAVSTIDIDGMGVISYDFTVNYDPNVITLDDEEKFGTISEDAAVEVQKSVGSIRLISANGIPYSGSGVLIYLTGTSHGEGVSDLTFTSILLNQGDVDGIGVNGGIEVGIGLADEEPSELPGVFVLKGNYPNPFNPSTTVSFDLPETSVVSITVFDVLGRQLMAVPPAMIQAGTDRGLQIDASSLPSGMYLYQVTAISATNTRTTSGRMSLIK